MNTNPYAATEHRLVCDQCHATKAVLRASKERPMPDITQPTKFETFVRRVAARHYDWCVGDVLDAYDLANDDIGDVLTFLREQKFIQAIKEYRTQTGASLADAKVAVERIRDEMGLA